MEFLPAPLYSGAAIKNAMYGILFPYTAQGSFGDRKNLETSLCTKCDERSIIMFANVRGFPLWYGGLVSVSQEAGVPPPASAFVFFIVPLTEL